MFNNFIYEEVKLFNEGFIKCPYCLTDNIKQINKVYKKLKIIKPYVYLNKVVDYDI